MFKYKKLSAVFLTILFSFSIFAFNVLAADPPSIDTANWSNVTWLAPNPNISSWTETAVINQVTISERRIDFPYDKADVWPGVQVYPDWNSDIVGVAWVFVWKDNTWNALTWEYIGKGRSTKDTSNITDDCRSFKIQPIIANQPYGFMVSTVPAIPGRGSSPIQERSNVVMANWTGETTPSEECGTIPGDNGDTIPPGGNPFPAQPIYNPPTQGLPTNLGQLISQIFTWSLGILGISVFVMFFYSGFLWLTAAGNTSRIGEAKTHMTNAVFGAILLLSSYLILYTINPDFVKNTVNLPGLGPTSQNPTQNTTGGSFVACDSPPNAISPDPMSVMQQVKSEFPNIDLTVEGPGPGTRDEFTAIVAWRLHQIDANWGRKRAAGPQSTDTLGYLRPDIGPGRFEAVDLVSGTTGNLIRGCIGMVDSGQTWINPVPAP